MVDTTGATEDDFLARERAALGEDADQFMTSQDNAAANEAVNADDDLLGGGGNDTPAPEIGAFESSFPSMDTQTQNEVTNCLLYCGNWELVSLTVLCLESCPWRYNHWIRIPVPFYWLSEPPRA